MKKLVLGTILLSAVTTVAMDSQNNHALSTFAIEIHLREKYHINLIENPAIWRSFGAAIESMKGSNHSDSSTVTENKEKLIEILSLVCNHYRLLVVTTKSSMDVVYKQDPLLQELLSRSDCNFRPIIMSFRRRTPEDSSPTWIEYQIFYNNDCPISYRNALLAALYLVNEQLTYLKAIQTDWAEKRYILGHLSGDGQGALRNHIGENDWPRAEATGKKWFSEQFYKTNEQLKNEWHRKHSAIFPFY